jgi:hypothetical protein
MEWISVKDKIPVACGNPYYTKPYLVYKDCGDGTIPSIDISNMWIETGEWYIEKDGGYRVTHWAELPEPPKE